MKRLSTRHWIILIYIAIPLLSQLVVDGAALSLIRDFYRRQSQPPYILTYEFSSSLFFLPLIYFAWPAAFFLYVAWLKKNPNMPKERAERYAKQFIYGLFITTLTFLGIAEMYRNTLSDRYVNWLNARTGYTTCRHEYQKRGIDKMYIAARNEYGCETLPPSGTWWQRRNNLLLNRQVHQLNDCVFQHNLPPEKGLPPSCITQTIP